MDRKSSGKSLVSQSQNNLDTFGYLPDPDIDLGRETGNEPESGARNQQEDRGENYLEGNLHYVQVCAHSPPCMVKKSQLYSLIENVYEFRLGHMTH